MRRTTGLVLIAVGALLLVLGPTLRFYVYPTVAVAPDNQTESISVGEDVEILDIASISAGADNPVQSMDITSTRTVMPDVEAGDDDVAVWETGVVNTGNGEIRSAYQARVAFDRHTAETVPDPGGQTYQQYHLETDNEADRQPVEHTGWVFKLPFNTEKTDYEWWDTSIQQSTPLVFDGEDTIDGLPVYRFVQEIEPTVLPDGDQDLPGSYFGSDEATVTAERHYGNTRTLWIEPQTGVVIRGQEEQDAYFEYDGAQLTVTNGTIGFAEDTVEANVEEYRSTATALNLIRNVLPIVLPIVGLIFAIVGILLVRQRQRPRRGGSGAAAVSDDYDDGGSFLDNLGEPRAEAGPGPRASRRQGG